MSILIAMLSVQGTELRPSCLRLPIDDSLLVLKAFQTGCVHCVRHVVAFLNYFIPRKVTCLTYAPHAAGVNGPVDFSLFI